ncbi:hypothetical protein [Algihabitans albus]|uniref:hypothetical protein n=1 Tax=Algihabitans albus TaxID=2164067 RepID=UPI000E5CB429|nr:hypothetical protein [Algihabitans albus]
MRLVFHLLGWLLVLCGLIVFAGDLLAYMTLDLFTLRPFGEVWAAIHRDSLAMLQPAIERHVWAPLWQDIIFPVLLWPAAPVLFALGLLVVLVTRRGAPPVKRRGFKR